MTDDKLTPAHGGTGTEPVNGAGEIQPAGSAREHGPADDAAPAQDDDRYPSARWRRKPINPPPRDRWRTK